MLARLLLMQLASLSCALAFPLIGTILEGTNAAVLVRDKRDPSRAMTFSGFMPGSGMSAFASSAEFNPYYRPMGHRPTGDGWGQYPAEPPAVEQPPERGVDRPWAKPDDKEKEEPEEDVGEEEEEPATPRPAKKHKKKYNTKEEDEEEDEERPSRTGGNAAASFNAWFPIMLGMFPSSGSYPGQGEEGGYSRGSPGAHRPPAPASHTTVIANSVSHGRSGVASSHAIAYGGGTVPHQGPPQHS